MRSHILEFFDIDISLYPLVKLNAFDEDYAAQGHKAIWWQSVVRDMKGYALMLFFTQPVTLQ